MSFKIEVNKNASQLQPQHSALLPTPPLPATFVPNLDQPAKINTPTSTLTASSSLSTNTFQQATLNTSNKPQTQQFNLNTPHQQFIMQQQNFRNNQLNSVGYADNYQHHQKTIQQCERLPSG